MLPIIKFGIKINISKLNVIERLSQNFLAFSKSYIKLKNKFTKLTY